MWCSSLQLDERNCPAVCLDPYWACSVLSSCQCQCKSVGQWVSSSVHAWLLWPLHALHRLFLLRPLHLLCGPGPNPFGARFVRASRRRDPWRPGAHAEAGQRLRAEGSAELFASLARGGGVWRQRWGRCLNSDSGSYASRLLFVGNCSVLLVICLLIFFFYNF